MAFRNPLTSLPAAGIVGQIQGSQLAADAIDGKVITGALIRTAAAGKRWEIGSGATNTIDAYSGSETETAAGILTIDSDPITGQGYIELRAPQTTPDGLWGRIIIKSANPSDTSTDQCSEAYLLADFGMAGPLSWTPEAGGITTLDGLVVNIPGQIYGQLHTISGSTVATPNAAGNIYIDYGIGGFTTVPQPVCTPGSGAGLCSCIGVGDTAAGGHATLYGFGGALITSGLRRVNWTVTGYLN